jgi:hypothetical protein
MLVFQFFGVPLHLKNRDVAQLVAYYVRDVGVGRSNRLIPTIYGNNTLKFNALFPFSF